MNTDTRCIIESHWQLGNERDWDGFGKLLHPQLRYEVPQTREYVDSGTGYLEMFRTWPGVWSAKIKTLVCDESQGIAVIDFAVGSEVMTGISIFQIADGLITQVTDYWPEPYEPAPRATAQMKRRAL